MNNTQVKILQYLMLNALVQVDKKYIYHITEKKEYSCKVQEPCSRSTALK